MVTHERRVLIAIIKVIVLAFSRDAKASYGSRKPRLEFFRLIEGGGFGSTAGVVAGHRQF